MAKVEAQAKQDVENMRKKRTEERARQKEQAGGQAVWQGNVPPDQASLVNVSKEGNEGNPLAQTDGSGIIKEGTQTQVGDGAGDADGADAQAAVGTGRIVTEIKYKPSSGVIFKANPDKTTTILGSYDKDMKNILNEMGDVKSTYFGPKKGGFNVLNVPDELYDPDTFWDMYNKPWLDEVINRGDDIALATKPDGNVLTRIDYSTGKEELTGFGKEYNYLIKKGYIYDAATNTMRLK